MKNHKKKKLLLNKRTVAKLQKDDQERVQAGFTTYYTCDCNTEHKSCSIVRVCCPPPEENIAQTIDC